MSSSSEPLTPLSTSSSADNFSNYSKSNLPFGSMVKLISQQHRALIQHQIENEMQKECEETKNDIPAETPTKKGPMLTKRQQATEKNNKVLQILFEKERKRYEKLEGEYWTFLKTPFLTEENFKTRYDGYKKNEKKIEMDLAESHTRLDEIFRRKLINETSHNAHVSFTSRRKPIKSRR